VRTAVWLFVGLFFGLHAHSTAPDRCVSCHHRTTHTLDRYHPLSSFGCATCHGGDPDATDQASAHRGIVRNPARLEHARIFCIKCHEPIIRRIERSLMQTQSGILNVLKYQWGETHDLNSTRTLQDIARERNASSLAEDHFAKACAACHVNQDEAVFDNPATARGGGCSDCHRLTKTDGDDHARYTTRIPNANCLKCHNRSNRIGLSYRGIFESEGYGTPYKQGKRTHRLPDGRFFYPLPADVHHRDGNMSCIDCHTEKGVMGDGKTHRHMEEAEDVKCRDCHRPKMAKPDGLAKLLSHLNGRTPTPKRIAYTAKMDAPLYHVQEANGSLLLYRKHDGKPLPLPRMSDAPYHTAPMHRRLDCSACHASWAPSCYGCHEVHFEKGKQYDWIKRKFTRGQWQEYRSFLRFESPSLGIGYNGKVMPFAPGCQVIGTLFTDKKVEQFHAMAMAGWDPHTTQKESRACVDCHFNPATLGLGRGNLDIRDGNISFAPFFDSRKSGMPFDYPIDAFVSTEGKPFQTTSRRQARGFNRDELHRIIEAYRCILCHDRYDDPIYRDFNASKARFKRRETPCAH
jgi:hypothetical protein